MVPKLIFALCSVASGRIVVEIAGGGVDVNGQLRKQLASESTRTQNGASLR
jgi:hypothetical protein